MTTLSPLILSQSLVDGDVTDDHNGKSIELLFLGCEDNPPYGPTEHTANLFLDLICRGIKACSSNTTNVVLKVFAVSKGNFPNDKDFENCNGVILPGSFNSAYDEEPWIVKLKQLIQKELVANQRPTMGVCFGHQLYAHSFEEGLAIKCPAGCQAGRKKLELTKEGLKWLTNNNKTHNTEGLDLYYTHGDMVSRLPPQGFSLGGNNKVPIQAAIYFAKSPTGGGDDYDPTNNKSNKPIAITFQAHPEFAASEELGLVQTFGNIIQKMEERNDITAKDRLIAEEDAKRQFKKVESNSIQTMVAVGKAFGWF